MDLCLENLNCLQTFSIHGRYIPNCDKTLQNYQIITEGLSSCSGVYRGLIQVCAGVLYRFVQGSYTGFVQGSYTGLCRGLIQVCARVLYRVVQGSYTGLCK